MNIGVDANNVRNTDMVNPFYGQYSETTGVGGLISDFNPTYIQC